MLDFARTQALIRGQYPCTKWSAQVGYWVKAYSAQVLTQTSGHPNHQLIFYRSLINEQWTQNLQTALSYLTKDPLCHSPACPRLVLALFPYLPSSNTSSLSNFTTFVQCILILLFWESPLYPFIFREDQSFTLGNFWIQVSFRSCKGHLKLKH